MISEAEANADSDKDFRDLVDIKNQADQVIHATEKSLEELGEKVTNEERPGRGKLKKKKYIPFGKQRNFADACVQAEFLMGLLFSHSGVAIFELD